MALKHALMVAECYQEKLKGFCKSMSRHLPVGSVVEIRRGRGNTKSGGWTGPYEVRAHQFNNPIGVILRNLKTGKIVRFHIGQTNIRECKKGA